MSGRLRDKIELLMRDNSVDSFGDRSEQYLTVGFRWGEVKDLSGREMETKMGQESEVVTRITLRHDSLTSTLTADDVLAHDGVKYKITQRLNKDSKKRFLLFMCVHDDR